MPGSVIALLAVCHLAALFALADLLRRRKPSLIASKGRPYVYALGFGVYCASWSMFGIVEIAAGSGWSYLALFLGPILLLTLCGPAIRRVIRLARDLNIASVADFLGARYGKSERVAAVVTIASILAVAVFLALQLRMVAIGVDVLIGPDRRPVIDPALAVAVGFALLAIHFGTRQVTAAERLDGLSTAIAVESIVKLLIFAAVGAFVAFGVADGFGEVLSRAWDLGAARPSSHGPTLASGLVFALLSFLAFLLLPRVFHMGVVENRDERDVGPAGVLFSLYLVLFAVLVAPLAVVGLAMFPDGSVAPSAYAMALPFTGGAPTLAVLVFLGGLSAAATAAIVECVAVAVMASNDLAIPLMLRRGSAQRADMTRRLLWTRRGAIAGVMALAYGVSGLIGAGEIGAGVIVAMAAVAQLGPAFYLGLVWRGANARGALAGIGAGMALWAWTLLLPAFARDLPALSELFALGPFGQSWLRPEALFGLESGDPVSRGVILSLALNALFFAIASLTRRRTTIEKQQALLFCGGARKDAAPPPPGPRPWRSRASAGELVGLVARYLGPERAGIAFRGFAIARGAPVEPKAEADLQLLRFTEHLLASAIGAASSRLVLSMLLTRRNVSSSDALRLLDEASAAMQTNRDVLQNALDHARQGVTAIDANMKLVCWNRQFRELFDLPEEMIHFGVGLDDIFRFNAARGLYGPVDQEQFIADRIDRFVVKLETLRTRLHPSGRVIEIRSARMPDGGMVTTYTDISDTVAAQEALERANETLERRVRDRTRELTRLNQELARAKTEADEANISKTRFLAAASHDILQPLNAARLFATSLAERSSGNPELGRLARNVDSSLDAVEEILSTLLDISRLDAGAMRPELANFRLDELTSQLAREFQPVAEDKGLELIVMPTEATVRSDRRLLRRVLQNLVSNAIKYTPSGRVLVGCRRVKGKVRIEVWDTGLGIAPDQQRVVFREFKRLDQGARVAPGLGLGLSIVERIARVLDHPLTLRSRPGKGSTFAIEMPVAAAMPTTRVVAAAARPASPALAGLTVLVIDNERAILDGMTTLLEGWGCVVVAAASQKEAELGTIGQKMIPDVMLADYHLDDADGLEAIVALRWKFGRPLPAVLITADRSPGLRAEADEKRVMMLPKPIRPAALRALLSQLYAVRAAAE